MPGRHRTHLRQSPSSRGRSSPRRNSACTRNASVGAELALNQPELKPQLLQLHFSRTCGSTCPRHGADRRNVETQYCTK